MSSSAIGAHILVFPFPAQGHMLPLLDLTHQLALHNLTITILVTPQNLPILTPFLSLHPSIQTLIFPFPPHPSLPSGIENVSLIGNRANIPIINALGKLHDPIIQWFKSHNKPPIATLSDFFLGWTYHLARQLGILRIVFYASGLLLASIVNHLWHHLQAVRSLPLVVFDELPRSPFFLAEHLPPMFRQYRESDPEWEFVKMGSIANTSSWACIFNSFDALEGEYLDHFLVIMGHPRVWGVGSLSLTGGLDLKKRGNLNPNFDSSVLNWLDGCPDGSVVYVCFGSQKLLKSDQMVAIASGLERSRTRFIWVIKSGTIQEVEDGYGCVPNGFEERVHDRGVVIKGWAPQMLILSHRAVGVFVSHCGWNSVLEGIVGGARILAWPMEADQFVNAKLLVEDMGVAARVCEGADAVPDSAELGRIIAESLNENVPVPQKVKPKELREKALIAAVKDGGSSSRDLNELVKELNKFQFK